MASMRSFQSRQVLPVILLLIGRCEPFSPSPKAQTFPAANRISLHFFAKQRSGSDDVAVKGEAPPLKRQYYKWDEMVGRLREYHSEYGHCRVREDEDGVLFHWCKRIRARYGPSCSSKLAFEKRQQLEDLNFPWNIQEMEWQKQFQELVAFVEEYGYFDVPHSYDPKLRNWVIHQRAHQKNGKMKPHRLKALESVGFWKVENRKPSKWDVMIARLQVYYEQHGHSLVKKSEDEDLHDWCKNVRMNYFYPNSKKPLLPQEKRAQLDQVEFCASVNEVAWMQNYKALKYFMEEEGHVNVPFNHESLGTWAANQRSQYRRFLQGETSSMTNERIELLGKLKFWDSYRSHESNWNQRFEELKEYRATYGDCNVPKNYRDNFQLGQWVMNQRGFYKQRQAGLATPLTAERIAALEGINFVWNLYEHIWNNMFTRLEKYHAENDTFKISLQDEDNKDLRFWLNAQRVAYKLRSQNRTSPMTDERQAALEGLPNFEWNAIPRGSGPSIEDWNQLFDQLRGKNLSMQEWLDTSYQESDDKEVYTDEDLFELWNAEDD